MDSVKSKQHTKLTAHERDLIAVWKGGGVSLREIARRLGRSHSTIIDEIGRNSFKGKHYTAIHAQAKAEKRKAVARRRHPLKFPKIQSIRNSKIKAWLVP